MLVGNRRIITSINPKCSNGYGMKNQRANQSISSNSTKTYPNSKDKESVLCKIIDLYYLLTELCAVVCFHQSYRTHLERKKNRSELINKLLLLFRPNKQVISTGRVYLWLTAQQLINPHLTEPIKILLQEFHAICY